MSNDFKTAIVEAIYGLMDSKEYAFTKIKSYKLFLGENCCIMAKLQAIPIRVHVQSEEILFNLLKKELTRRKR